MFIKRELLQAYAERLTTSCILSFLLRLRLIMSAKKRGLLIAETSKWPFESWRVPSTLHLMRRKRFHIFFKRFAYKSKFCRSIRARLRSTHFLQWLLLRTFACSPVHSHLASCICCWGFLRMQPSIPYKTEGLPTFLKSSSLIGLKHLQGGSVDSQCIFGLGCIYPSLNSLIFTFKSRPLSANAPCTAAHSTPALPSWQLPQQELPENGTDRAFLLVNQLAKASERNEAILVPILLECARLSPPSSSLCALFESAL